MTMERYCILSIQVRPVILCLTATLTDSGELGAMRLLGITNPTRMACNPVNPRISFHNSGAQLDMEFIASLLTRREECPRLILFEDSLKECGKKYRQLQRVRHSI